MFSDEVSHPSLANTNRWFFQCQKHSFLVKNISWTLKDIQLQNQIIHTKKSKSNKRFFRFIH